MAQAALRTRDDFDTDIVRRLMARPLRVVPAETVGTEEAPETAEVVILHPPVAEVAVAAVAPSADVARLEAQLLVMKAVLKAERTESAHLRACIEQIADPAPLSPEAQAVRDRWASLVDQLLHSPR